MDEINTLENLALVLPSPLYIAGAILFGIVGLVAFTPLPRRAECPANALMWDIAPVTSAQQRSTANLPAPLFTDPDAAASMRELLDPSRTPVLPGPR